MAALGQQCSFTERRADDATRDAMSWLKCEYMQSRIGEEFDALVTKAKETADIGERTKLYEQAQVVFKREAPWNTLDHSLVVVPMSKKVTGFKMDPLGIHRFDGVDIAE